MVSFLCFLARQRKMPGFPTHIVGTPTIRGKARRYKDGEKIKADPLLVRKAGPGTSPEEKRDFSLREPTHSSRKKRGMEKSAPERMRKKESARSVRNDGWGVGGQDGVG